MNKKQMLALITAQRKKWDGLLAQMDSQQLVAPILEGNWSAKDVIAHITWFEREMVAVVRERALVGSELWDLPTDERNATIFAQNQERSLTDVQDEAQQVHRQLLQALETLGEKDLHDAACFANMPAAWTPWQIIADNTFEHYQAHAGQLRQWLALNE